MNHIPIPADIVKNLPVKEMYEDFAKSAATQGGLLASDTMKTLHLLAAPIQFLGAVQDRYRAFLDKTVRRVPEDKFIAPEPQILGPVLEGIRFEPEDTSIYEMFLNLLSNAADKDSVAQVHPAYPALIRQLSSDEAIFLMTLHKGTYHRITEWDMHTKDRQIIWLNKRIVENTFPLDVLKFPERLNFYIDHAHALGIAGMYNISDTDLRDSSGKQTGTRKKEDYRLTPLGEDFITACIRET